MSSWCKDSFQKAVSLNFGKTVTKLLTLSIISLSTLLAHGQSQPAGVTEIMALMSQDNILEARSKTEFQITKFKKAKQLDSLPAYIYVLGQIELRENDEDSTTESDALYDVLDAALSQPISRFEMAVAKVKLLIDKGAIADAQSLSQEALSNAQQAADIPAQVTALYYMADCCLKTGQIVCMEDNSRAALSLMKGQPETEFPISPRVLNLMAATMYYSSKPDSAIYYWNAALDQVELMPDLPENKLYLPAILKGNLSLIFRNIGEFAVAMKMLEESMALQQQFISETKNHPFDRRVRKAIVLVYNNLAGIYSDVGDLRQAKAIAAMEYKYAKKHLLPCSQEYSSAILTLADNYSFSHDLDKAKLYLQEVDQVNNDCPDKNLNTLAHIQSSLGSLHYQSGNIESSIKAYQRADSLYNLSFPGEYNWNRFYVAMNLSIMLSEGGRKDESIKLATDLYNHFNNSEDGNEYFASSLLLTLSRVTLDQGEPAQSIEWAEKGLMAYTEQSENEETVFSASYEFERSKLIMLKTMAKYELGDKTDIDFLKELVDDMQQCMRVLEKRKSIMNSSESVNDLMEQNLEVFEFVKKLYLDLYTLTEDPMYVDKLVALHESALYGRIRSRLNTKATFSFAGVPSSVMKREHHLRRVMNLNLNEENILDFNQHAKEWRSFLDSVRVSYPEYYEMRYAKIEKPMSSIVNDLPEQTTVIRYMILDEKVYAFVITEQSQKLVELSFDIESKKIDELNQQLFDTEHSAKLLIELYQELWAPIENFVQTENVVIIPDGLLYNLGFESLISAPSTDAQNPWKNALLFKHFISYNFSLFLLSDVSDDAESYGNLASFVPEFNEEMKNSYLSAQQDSSKLDEDYLKLIPQPFARSLAEELAGRSKGDSYLNTMCTEQNFVTHAGGNKVIFIGTHAESDNVSPEMSRFIFAKSPTSQDNSLYSYEIYNCNLSSDLAILTACETSKPTYQPGEGMVSLAHAFNYAGSKSLLTSLWKIDEQTSIDQVESFYSLLEKGYPKDQALAMAKREFIQNGSSAQTAPGYWSGMVMLGDTSPIDLDTSLPWMKIALGLLGLLFFVFVAKRLRLF